MCGAVVKQPRSVPCRALTHEGALRALARTTAFCDVIGFPEWCADNWCYIDPSNCNLVATQGTYFTDDLFFSYRTCGNTNTFSRWFGNAPGGDGQQHELVELVNLTSRYLESIVIALEQAEAEIRTADLSSGCSYASSCNCCGCEDDETWSGGGAVNQITLRRTTTTPYPTPAASPPNIDACLSEIVASQFQRVAATEADPGRVGYEYYGSQLGTYMQWPGVQYCPESYDPRFVRSDDPAASEASPATLSAVSALRKRLLLSTTSPDHPTPLAPARGLETFGRSARSLDAPPPPYRNQPYMSGRIRTCVCVYASHAPQCACAHVSTAPLRFLRAQRPWFSAGVSGPKDVIVVIDTSGSMRGTRIRLAEEAATWAAAPA